MSFPPSGFEPGFDPRLAHYSNVTHIHGLFGSALQNTYISCLGHDDASSVSFDWANACAVLPRPVSGASRAERVLGPVETESDVQLTSAESCGSNIACCCADVGGYE